jgi:hypothetical protein
VAVRLRLFRAHRRLREDLRDRMWQKKRRSTSEMAGPFTPKHAKPNRREEFLPMNSVAEFACGD